MSKLTFSGHESFQCRHLWLKKGYDFINNGKSFADDSAVVHLGVGKNMVNSIRYWMKAFNILTLKDELTPLAHRFFSDTGWDPYLEDEASLWVLHYQLVKTGHASIYSLVFNELRREKIEFSKENFVHFVKRKVKVQGTTVNEGTLQEDFSVFTKMYLRSDTKAKDKEDAFAGLLCDLNLVRNIEKSKDPVLVIENTERKIPTSVLLYAILDNVQFDASVSFAALENGHNSVASVFALNRNALQEKVEELVHEDHHIVFNTQAGLKEIQFKKKPSKPLDVLNRYFDAN